MEFEAWICRKCGYRAVTPSKRPVCKDCGAEMEIMTDPEERDALSNEVKGNLASLF